MRNDKLSGTSAISTALREGWWEEEEEEGNRVKRESVCLFFFVFLEYIIVGRM